MTSGPSGNVRQADIAIVGGGAAGLATAIFAARRNRRHRVIVLDGARKLGAKILISGGGRCNVTNDVVTEKDYCGGSRNVIRRVLASFPVTQTVAFFREIGVPLHAEAGGKMFPDTNRARTVLDALLGEASRLEISILPGERVIGIEQRGNRFTLTTPAGTCTVRRVALATGGLSVPKTGSDGTGYRLAESLGHSLVPRTPALVPLLLDGDWHVHLSGVSQEVEFTVQAEGARPLRVHGSMLWTHFGVSGPVVLDASRHWHAARLQERSVQATVSFLPGQSFEQTENQLIELASAQPRTEVHNALATLVPARVADALLDTLRIGPSITLAQLPRDTRRRLVHALLEWPLPIRESRGYQYAEVTAGGVPLDEIDPGTMESRRCPGLFLVGEILDVDGRIGGFNFQWAWSSAWVAAAGMCRAE